MFPENRSKAMMIEYTVMYREILVIKGRNEDKRVCKIHFVDKGMAARSYCIFEDMPRVKWRNGELSSTLLLIHTASLAVTDETTLQERRDRAAAHQDQKNTQLRLTFWEATLKIYHVNETLFDGSVRFPKEAIHPHV